VSTEYTVALRSHDAGGVLYENTFAVKSDPSGPDIAEASDADVAHGVDDWLRATYQAVLSTRYTWDDVQVRGILGHDGEAVRGIGINGTLSLVGAVPAPKELVMVVSVKTAHVGRTGRGHMAMPSPANANYLADATSWANSGAAGAFYGNVQAFCTALLAGHDFTYAGGTLTAHLSMRLWSRKDALTRDVNSLVPRLPVRWLRSRSTAP